MSRPVAVFGADEKTIDELVLSATEALLKQPDWGANTVLCDIIAQHPTQGPALMKALKPRVLHKDPHVAVLAIALMESLVKNCPAFHPLVANKDFLKDFIKTVPKKVRDPQSKSLFRLDSHSDADSVERTDRVLVVIQSWATAFSGSKQFPAFGEVYRDLLSKGAKFPEPTADETAPVFTPPKKPPPPPKAQPKQSKPVFTDEGNRGCYESAEVLDTMLTASDPRLDLRKHELIPDLVASMRAAQAGLQEKVASGRITSDVMLNETLIANDAMQSAIRYYEGLVNGTMSRKSPAQLKAAEKEKEKEKENEKQKESQYQKEAPKHKSEGKAASASGMEGIGSPAKLNGQYSTPKKIVPILAPPSSNQQAKGRHGGSPQQVAASPSAAGMQPVGTPPLLNLQQGKGVASPAVAPAPAPAAAKPVDDLSDLFFGGGAAAAAPAMAVLAASATPTPAAAPTPVMVTPIFAAPTPAASAAPASAGINPFAPAPAPAATPAGAKAASILDQFLNPTKPAPAASVPTLAPPPNSNPFAPAPAPPASAAYNPYATPQAVPVPIPARQSLQPVLAAHYSVGPAPVAAAPAAAAASRGPAPAAPIDNGLDDDPFAAFAARDMSAGGSANGSGGGGGAASASASASNTTLEENPFDMLARR